MKPFSKVSNIKTFHTPIDVNLNILQLNNLIKTLNPKRLICPFDYQDQIKISETTVMETLNAGQTLTLSEDQMGKLKYMGLCPVNLANLIKQKHKISRISGLEIEFKDQKYHVLNVYKKQDYKSRDKLFFKLLD